MLHKIFSFFLLFISLQLTAQRDSNSVSFKKEMDSGYHYLRNFMPEESLAHFEKGIEQARKLNKNFWYAAALFGAGQATWYAGNFKNAADTVNMAIRYFPADKKGDIIGAYRILSNIYDDLGEYENAFRAVQAALSMNGDVGEHNKVLPLIQMGKLYQNIGDLESAFHYYQLARDENPTVGDYPFRELNHNLGNLYVARNQLDSASYFYRLSFRGNPNSRLIRLRLGDLYLLKKQYDSANYYLQPLYEEMIAVKDVNLVSGTSISLAKIAYERGDFRRAEKLAGEGFALASQKGVFRFYKEASGLLAAINEKLGDVDSALHYRKLYDSLKDAGTSDIYKGQLFAFRQKTHASALQSLRDEKKIAERTIIIVCLAAALAIAFIIFRYQHIRLRLKQRASDLEMQALRAQMNPHFIFNCLSAINHFILDNQNDKASDYLTRFSRLVRMVLVNAGKDSIPLDEELDMLRLYLDMEQLRFKHAFTYTIDIRKELPLSHLQMPCFILQPFCENAIWHGLLHKEGEGRLEVILDYKKETLRVVIRDNGIGRKKAAELSKKPHSSMGQQLTASRLTLFNRESDKRMSMKINDLVNINGEAAGTEVILFIQTPLLQ